MTDIKRSRKPVFFRPDFRRRVVQGRDYLHALWKKGGRFWEGRSLAMRIQPAGARESKPRKGGAPSRP